MSMWPTAQVPAYLIDTMRVSPVRPEPQASTHEQPVTVGHVPGAGRTEVVAIAVSG